MSKIEISSGSVKAGSFVKTLTGSTGMGFAEGTHVHKDWYARTKSYENVMESTQRAIESREDILTEMKNISCGVSLNGQFALVLNDGRKFVPTDHCLEQFSTRVGVPSSTVMRELRKLESYDGSDGETMAHIGNNAIRKIETDKKFRLRTYTDGTCRAFVTEQYAPIDNRWYLEILNEFIPGGRFSHWRGDEDTMYGNILIPETIMDYGQGDDTDYGGMISVGNCEIGTRRISQTPSLFRAICMNGCIWGQQESKDHVKRVHRGKIDLDVLKLNIANNIQDQIPLLAPGITRFLATRAMELGKSSAKSVIAVVASQNHLSKKEATEFLEQYITKESGERSLFGIINGLTRAGQTFNNQGWVRMDELAGDLLAINSTRWLDILRRADTFGEKDYEKVFSLTA